MVYVKGGPIGISERFIFFREFYSVSKPQLIRVALLRGPTTQKEMS